MTSTSALYQPLAVAGSDAWVTGAVRSIRSPSTVRVVGLPARSATVAELDSASPSPVSTVLGGQAPSIPESGSEQSQSTVTSSAYQPCGPGAIRGAPARVGALVSMSRPETVVDDVLPARSVADPRADRPAPSARVTGAGQPSGAIPASASVQLKSTRTGARYQPEPFGSRSTAAEITGAVRSRLTVTGSSAWLPATSAARPATTRPAASVSTRTGSEQDSTPERPSAQRNVTVTGDRCQPAWFGSVLSVCRMLGAVPSIRTWAVR